MSKKTNVDSWLELEDEHKRRALEQASREFDDGDSLSIHTLEAIHGKESSFGKKSKASEKAKDMGPNKIHSGNKDGHWITDENGNHIFIEDK